MPRALLSVTDKTNLVPFATALTKRGYELVSTGGTAKALVAAGLKVTDAGSLTGFGEMLDGRVKTLHPAIHAGLLADTRLEDHRNQLQNAKIEAFDILCVNLYAFEETVSKPHSLEEAIESIDIGGPAMIRAASKNHGCVAVVVEPGDYDKIIEAIDEGSLQSMKLALAAKAFRHTAYYDSMIARYLSEVADAEMLTPTITVGLRKDYELRYGENSHQKAALYLDPLVKGGLVRSRKLWGKELSYNNINDGDRAWELVCDLPTGACAIIKHGNPCGAAVGTSFADSYALARSSDTISAFGGIAAFNGVIDEAAALAMTEKGNFLEVVVGTKFSPEALEVFKTRSGWGQDVRLLEAEPSASVAYLSIKTLRGGALVQDSDEDPMNKWEVKTKLQPTEAQLLALKLQWAIIPHVNSNAIVIGNERQLLGVGAGQMNRVQSVRLAIEQAGEKVAGAVLASDAFFPFPDSIETASKAGISAVIQPGGSKKDGDVIAAADSLGIAMVFTGTRHFRH